MLLVTHFTGPWGPKCRVSILSRCLSSRSAPPWGKSSCPSSKTFYFPLNGIYLMICFFIAREPLQGPIKLSNPPPTHTPTCLGRGPPSSKHAHELTAWYYLHCNLPKRNYDGGATTSISSPFRKLIVGFSVCRWSEGQWKGNGFFAEFGKKFTDER